MTVFVAAAAPPPSLGTLLLLPLSAHNAPLSAVVIRGRRVVAFIHS
jgi:hypothetical protein